jgi:hypothetical protein
MGQQTYATVDITLSRDDAEMLLHLLMLRGQPSKGVLRCRAALHASLGVDLGVRDRRASAAADAASERAAQQRGHRASETRAEEGDVD